MKKSVGVSVRSVLALEDLASCTLRAGERGLDRVVLSINVMEVPDIIDWVSPGELLVTTGFSVKNEPSLLAKLIPELHKKGVAGLGIKPKRFLTDIPEDVLRIADEIGFPVFEISSEVAFPEIISKVLTLIVNRQNNVLQDIHNLHKSLTLTMLHGGNMQQISEIIYERFGNSVAIISDYFSSFAISTTDEKMKPITEIIELEKKIQFATNGEHLKTYTHRTKLDNVGGEEYQRIVVPICSDNINYGNIYMWEDKRHITAVEEAVIESVTSLIALEIVKKSSMLQLENSHKSGFVNALLSEDRQKYEESLHNAKYFDFNPEKAHQVIVVHLKEIKDGVTISGDTLYRLNNIMIGILQQIARNTTFKILFVNQDNTIILLCETPSSSSDDSKNELLNLINKLVGQFTRGGLSELVSVGVGRSYERPRDLYKSLEEAKRASRFPMLKEKNAIFYEDMGIYRILSYENLTQELHVFCLEMIQPLIDYDRDKDLELLPTLANYFKVQGNMTNLSKHLGVHYNTVVYRLQKIAELTGMDLSNETDLLNLQIALKIYAGASDEEF